MMSVQVYGCNHVAIEVGDVEKAVAFYRDVFNLEQLDQAKAMPSSSSASINSWRCSRSRMSGQTVCGILHHGPR